MRERCGQSCARIGQCHAEDCKVHALVRRQLRRCSSRVDVNALAVHLDQKRKRFPANPVGRALRRRRLRRGFSGDRPACEGGRSNGTLPNNRSCVADNTRIFHGPIRRTSPGFTASPDEAPARLARSTLDADAIRRARVFAITVGNIQQVIEMSVRHQNRVRFWREMTQSIVDAGRVWLNARTKCYAQKVHAREVRIDQQGVSFEFELVTVRAEISHAHAVARRRAANRSQRVARNDRVPAPTLAQRR